MGAGIWGGTLKSSRSYQSVAQEDRKAIPAHSEIHSNRALGGNTASNRQALAPPSRPLESHKSCCSRRGRKVSRRSSDYFESGRCVSSSRLSSRTFVRGSPNTPSLAFPKVCLRTSARSSVFAHMALAGDPRKFGTPASGPGKCAGSSPEPDEVTKSTELANRVSQRAIFCTSPLTRSSNALFVRSQIRAAAGSRIVPVSPVPCRRRA